MTNEQKKEFRKLLYELSDITTEFDIEKPIKGEIYFDGIEVEQWIDNLFKDLHKKVFEIQRGFENRGTQNEHEEGEKVGGICACILIRELL